MTFGYAGQAALPLATGAASLIMQETSQPVIPAEAKRRAGIQKKDWIPVQARNDALVITGFHRKGSVFAFGYHGQANVVGRWSEDRAVADCGGFQGRR